MQKEDILAEIRRTAEENGGKPLGMRTFEKETGISTYDWGKYWARFGDAQKEAGFVANQLNPAYDEGFMITKAIGVMRNLKKFPTFKELRIARLTDPEIPDMSVFHRRFGSKAEFARKIVKYCESRTGFDDVIELSMPIANEPSRKRSDDNNQDEVLGEVYLFKSGRHYKIGMTKDTVRRGNELRIQLPERMDLIHSIKTDDPSGIEAYWHRRFADKRMNGEWFDLNSTDIRAFKRWRKIV